VRLLIWPKKEKKSQHSAPWHPSSLKSLYTNFLECVPFELTSRANTCRFRAPESSSLPPPPLSTPLSRPLNSSSCACWARTLSAWIAALKDAYSSNCPVPADERPRVVPPALSHNVSSRP
jgi:hypothetical protein